MCFQVERIWFLADFLGFAWTCRLRCSSGVRMAPGDDAAPTNGPLSLTCFRPALRTVRRLFAQSGVGLEGDWSSLCEMAAAVQKMDEDYHAFSQRRWSSRTEHRAQLEGVVGQAWFVDVPSALLPWLYWGGLLHLGGNVLLELDA